ALEHQMLEQVRETGASFGLRPEADVVENRDADDRRRPIGCEHDAQPVVERVAGDVEGRGGQLLRAWHQPTLRSGVARLPGGQPTWIDVIVAGTLAQRDRARSGSEVYQSDTSLAPTWIAAIQSLS